MNQSTESWQVIDEQRLVTSPTCWRRSRRRSGPRLPCVRPGPCARSEPICRWRRPPRWMRCCGSRFAHGATSTYRSARRPSLAPLLGTNAEIIADLRNIVGSQRLASRDLLARPVARRPGAWSGSEPPDRPPRWRCRSRPPGPPPTGPGNAGSRSLPRDDSAASGWSPTTSTGPRGSGEELRGPIASLLLLSTGRRSARGGREAGPGLRAPAAQGRDGPEVNRSFISAIRCRSSAAVAMAERGPPHVARSSA